MVKENLNKNQKKKVNNIIEFLLNKGDLDKLLCVDSDSKYTYKEAVDIVKRIATFFYEQGISNQPIMLKAERNCATLLTIFGIILSNNYYVPVNADLSEEKLGHIIESSKIKYEVAFNDVYDNRLKSFDYSNIIKTNIDVNAINYFKSNFNENNNIYTVYTSGSTGVPKGVLKTHKNTISFVENFMSTFNFEDDLRIANQSPLFFDASMKDVFLTFAGGGTLYFPEKTLFAMPLKLVEYLNENQINFICWVPSALTIIVKLKTFNYLKPQYLRYVFFVGEVFIPKYLNIWIEQLPFVTYVNIYGSTEIAGVCLYKVINHKLPEDKPIPLGRPLNNNNVYLDDGEIVVESDQIASCYVNDDVKNSQVFGFKNGKRALKTGDYAFLNEDNDFVFTSRKDYQIKHMGYRIELQELDLSVGALSYIDNCSVLFDDKNDKIVAFTTLNTTLDNPVKVILNDLKQKLPPYMMPNVVRVLDTMPLNANGKIDRVKLKSILEN